VWCWSSQRKRRIVLCLFWLLSPRTMANELYGYGDFDLTTIAKLRYVLDSDFGTLIHWKFWVFDCMASLPCYSNAKHRPTMSLPRSWV
jgi:hypothetical protein